MCLLCSVLGLAMKPLNIHPHPDNKSADTVIDNKTILDKTLYKVVDKKILQSIPFLIVLISNLLSLQGVYIAYTFLPGVGCFRIF